MKEQELIAEAIQEMKDQANRDFKAKATTTIKGISERQQKIAALKVEITRLQAELKALTLDQVEIDLG